MGPPIDKVGKRNTDLRSILRQVVARYCQDPIRLLIRQSLEQNRIYNREHRCICADAECQRQHRHESKSRRLGQHPQAEKNVLP